MELLKQVWDYFTKVPSLLSQYGEYSTPLLTVMLAGGLIGVVTLVLLRVKSKKSISTTAMMFFAGFTFLSAAGFYLKEMGAREEQGRLREFVTEHKFGPGQYGIVVFNFNMPRSVDESRRQRFQDHMLLLVHTVTYVLAEDLPPDVAMPRVINLSTDGSPWQKEGVTQQNVAEVIDQLNAIEILWGSIYERETSEGAKVFLGLHSSPHATLDPVYPLRDVLLDEDPRADQQFGEGRYQLLGTVALGIALRTLDDARKSTGENRRELLLKAAQQIVQTREALNSRKEDPVLKRTLYSSQVSGLLDATLREAGVQP